MKEEWKNLTTKKSFHIGILLLIILIILLILGFITLRYQVEGETNMPFVISKISIISSSEGIDKDESVEGNKWNFDINQNNDIYIYVEKNEEFEKQEAIDEINVENIVMSKQNEKGILKTYKPDITNANVIFSNKEENEIQNITYTADENSDMKNLKITNQGGIVAFIIANNKIAEYVANDEEINHNDLLKKTNITQEELKINLQFEFIIKLNSGKKYKSTIDLELPLEGVIEKGTDSKEFVDMEKYIFKRVQDN